MQGRYLATTLNIGLIVTMLLCLKFKVGNGLKRQKEDAQLVKHPRETNPVNFVRLLLLRLIYGVAKQMGFDDGLSEVADGAFVPPGVEYDYGVGLDNRDYSYNDDDY